MDMFAAAALLGLGSPRGRRRFDPLAALLGLRLAQRVADADLARRAPATLALLVLNVAFFITPIADSLFGAPGTDTSVALCPSRLVGGEHPLSWLLVPSFMHANDGGWHIYYNMGALLTDGVLLERAVGTKRFVATTAAITLLKSLLYIAVSYAVTAAGLSNTYNTCVHGFSGVLFGFSALLHGPLGDRVFVQRTRRIPLLDTDVEIEYIIWVELLLASVLCYNVSFVGHLSGILAGLAVGYGSLLLEATQWISYGVLLPEAAHWEAEPGFRAAPDDKPAQAGEETDAGMGEPQGLPKERMHPTDAIASGLRKTFTKAGRASRSEYWYYLLFGCAALFGINALADFLMQADPNLKSDAAVEFVTMCTLIVILACLVVLPLSILCATVRRFHDTGHSGWWVLLWIFPMGNLLVLFWLMRGSEPHHNAFGSVPMNEGLTEDERRRYEDKINRSVQQTCDHVARRRGAEGRLNALRAGAPGREPAREHGRVPQEREQGQMAQYYTEVSYTRVEPNLWECYTESANPTSPEELRARRLAKYDTKTQGQPKEPRKGGSKLARWKKESEAREAAARGGGATIRAGVLQRPQGQLAQAEQPGQSPELSSHFSRAQRASAAAIRQRSVRSRDAAQELADNLASAANRTASERQQLLRQARRREEGFRNVH